MRRLRVVVGGCRSGLANPQICPEWGIPGTAASQWTETIHDDALKARLQMFIKEMEARSKK